MPRFEIDRRRIVAVAAASIGALICPAASRQSPAAPMQSEHPNSVVALTPRRLLFASPERSIARISPDGRRLAFLAPLNGILNVWVGAIDDIGQARPLTRVSDRDVGPDLVWLANNRHVVFFREQGGDENWQAHRLDVEDESILALTPGPGVKCYLHQLSRHFPDELLIAHNARDRQFFDIHRVDARTGASTLIEANDGFAGFFTDPQFRVRFATRQTDDGGLDYLHRGHDGAWQLFTRVDMADTMTTRPIEFSDDGRELYWLDSRGRDKAAVVAQDLETGTTRVLAEDPRADMVELELDPQSLRPIASVSVFTRRTWHVIDPDDADDFARFTKVLDADVVSVKRSQNRRHAVVYCERDAASGRFFHYDRSAGKAHFLFAARPALDDTPLVPMEPVILRARDGLQLVCYLSRPLGWGKDQPLPMVLLVHGGPWGRDFWGLSATHQWLANRGYAVLSVNYRGSTGFGKAFVNAANLEWAGKMHDDLIDAVDWAIGRGIADDKRVAIYGGSYGGYSALVGATFTPEKFACAVDLFGISNLLTFLGTIPDYWKPWQTIWKARMGDYTSDAGRKLLQDRSPLNRVDRIVRPLLIGQGANDVRVKPSESAQIVAAMQERRIPVTYVSYADEGHGFRRAENRRSFTAVAELFLARHLGGRCEPVGDDFAGSTIEFKAGRELIPGLG